MQQMNNTSNLTTAVQVRNITPMKPALPKKGDSVFLYKSVRTMKMKSDFW